MVTSAGCGGTRVATGKRRCYSACDGGGCEPGSQDLSFATKRYYHYTETNSIGRSCCRQRLWRQRKSNQHSDEACCPARVGRGGREIVASSPANITSGGHDPFKRH